MSCYSMKKDFDHFRGGEIESTSAPWVILLLNVNISLVGLIVLSSMFQICSTTVWQGQEDVEPLQNSKDKYWQKLKTLHLYFGDPRSH